MTRKEHIAACAKEYLRRMNIIGIWDLKYFMYHYNENCKTDLTLEEVEEYMVWL